MTPLQLPATDGPLRVLAVGAHADDIEIGAAGTLLAWQQARPVEVCAVVLSASAERRAEAERSAELLYVDASDWTLHVDEFTENLFPQQVGDLKTRFAALRPFDPHVILTTRLADRHQDHRTVAELTWQAFRDHLVLQYEIPKWEGDLSTPTTYSPLDAATIERKVRIIETAFASQHDKQWFDADLFRGLARVRGAECGVRFAEGFHSDKAQLVP